MPSSGRSELETQAAGFQKGEPSAATSSDDPRPSASKDSLDLECMMCGSISTDKAHLERHLLTHTNFGYFNCEICSESFVERGEFKEHMATKHQSSNRADDPQSADQSAGSSVNRHEIIVIGDDSDHDDRNRLDSTAVPTEEEPFSCDGGSELKIVNTMTLNPEVRNAPIVIDDDDDDDASSNASTVEWKEPEVLDDICGENGQQAADPSEEPADKDSPEEETSKSPAEEPETEEKDRSDDDKLDLDMDLSEAFNDSDGLQISDYFMVVSEASKDGDEDEGNSKKDTPDKSENGSQAKSDDTSEPEQDDHSKSGKETTSLKRRRSASPPETQPEINCGN